MLRYKGFVKGTTDRQFPATSEWQVLHFIFLKLFGSPLLTSHQGSDETGRGHYVKLSLEYTLILLLPSITVLSDWLYFKLSIFFKACFVWICLTYLRYLKRGAFALYSFKNSQVPHIWSPWRLPAAAHSSDCILLGLCDCLFPHSSGSWGPPTHPSSPLMVPHHCSFWVFLP